jgi:anion-transporting  ArsA/GET3 family ATPase
MRVQVCVGSGGVGKTTVAAALAARAANTGERAVVVTIDPARRLADALGMGGQLSGEPRRLAVEGPGELWASMLDSKATFDRLVTEQAAGPEQAARILANRYYRNMSGALSGTQEYMAAEELYRLAHDPRFDLVVVDTPPSRHALDFVDAPQRLVRLLENRVYRLLVSPSRPVTRAVSLAARAVLRTTSSVVGAQVIEDAVEFFTAFDGMEDGFRERARTVTNLLAGPECAFVVVTSPRADAVDEAVALHDALGRRGIEPTTLVVNLLHENPLRAIPEADRAQLASAAGALARRWEAALGLSATSDQEETAVHPLTARFADDAIIRIPRLDEEVRDLAGLTRFGELLTTVPR